VTVGVIPILVDTAPDLTVAVYFTSEKLLQDDPDLVKRFTEAMNESLATPTPIPTRPAGSSPPTPRSARP
jgi:hypothetical protein